MMMFSKDIPSIGTILSSYASIMGYVSLIKPMVNTVIPSGVQNFVVSHIKSLADSRLSNSNLTLIINEKSGLSMRGTNKLYHSAHAYLSSKKSPDASKLRMSRDPNNEKVINLDLCTGEVVSDVYQGIALTWNYLAAKKDDGGNYSESLELSFEKKHRDLVLNSYVPYLESKAKEIKNEKRVLKMFSNTPYSGWECVKFEHPSTFHTMALNEEIKRSVVGDLDRFIKRKDFYKRVGKAWKRGYLLYGPPGTGKSSLVAAMANYLKFDIYDLQLASVDGDAALRKLLLNTKNSSILVVEDIDCSVELPTRLQPTTTTPNAPKGKTPLTLSGLLNCIDGLWSSCGDERIIIFTTNHKEMLDDALLRPGRMDMHIYMGHCSFEGFKILASNYLGMSHNNDDTHRLYPEIEHLVNGEVMTPAQVAEELMKDEDADAALEGLVNVLKRKRSESEKCVDESNKKMKTIKDIEET